MKKDSKYSNPKGSLSSISENSEKFKSNSECSIDDICFVCNGRVVDIKQKRICSNCGAINQTCCD